MQGEQKDQFQESVNEMVRRANEVRGFEEDESEVRIPDDIDLWCEMSEYRWRRHLHLGGLAVANPDVTISINAYQAKSHLNRFIGCVEDMPENITNGLHAALYAAQQIASSHEGKAHMVSMFANAGLPMAAYLTGAKQTQEVDLNWMARIDGDGTAHVGLGFKVPYHTVCPFMIREADGHSHTQRTYLSANLACEVREGEVIADLLDIVPIITELNQRLTPGQSRMKIPDEAFHVARAYTTPTYTEWGALQIISAIRDVKRKVFGVHDDRELRVSARVRSIESIFCNDIVSHAETTLQ
jgi:GTP cyclohydrolase FolE2